VCVCVYIIRYVHKSCYRGGDVVADGLPPYIYICIYECNNGAYLHACRVMCTRVRDSETTD